MNTAGVRKSITTGILFVGATITVLGLPESIGLSATAIVGLAIVGTGTYLRTLLQQERAWLLVLTVLSIAYFMLEPSGIRRLLTSAPSMETGVSSYLLIFQHEQVPLSVKLSIAWYSVVLALFGIALVYGILMLGANLIRQSKPDAPPERDGTPQD